MKTLSGVLCVSSCPLWVSVTGNEKTMEERYYTVSGVMLVVHTCVMCEFCI